jgi:SAM-dependent methyltransferase
MRLPDAVAMFAGSGLDALGSTTWADLGCGDGTFTLALASVLGSGSQIHAIDLDGSALRKIPPEHHGVRIVTHRGDFTASSWPFADLDGILMANSLHYVEDQAGFIRRCDAHLKARQHFLIVEYDTDDANRWVPFPVSLKKLSRLFEDAGYGPVRVLSSRPSRYRRASLYSAIVGNRR